MRRQPMRIQSNSAGNIALLKRDMPNEQNTIQSNCLILGPANRKIYMSQLTSRSQGHLIP